MFDKRATWGGGLASVQIQYYQSTLDQILLNTLRAGLIWVQFMTSQMGVSRLAVKKLFDLVTVIVPFFLSYPLFTLKSNHFEI
jgi:uncharacterized membrane protein